MNALEDKKAEDIVLLDVQGLSSFTDYYIIATGTSDRHLDALAEGLAEHMRKQLRQKSPRIQGQPAGGWVLVDCRDVVAHLFSAAQRDRYKLEELWNEAKTVLRIQ
ncbi:MAG TPA: ribosome silencing factor [Anaerolineales bacterium]|nr:ribosome silencing factor [Anaerolineales bacterium]